jgi:hypothetical protein
LPRGASFTYDPKMVPTTIDKYSIDHVQHAPAR